MTENRTIAVLGATGAQGGGLVDAILADPDGGFTVRALTRNPDSEQARRLAERGAEVTQADLDDPASLTRAFTGAYGVYGLTNFWEHMSAERETSQAKNIADAAREAGPSHVIWSTFEDTRHWVPLDDNRMPTLQGRYKVPHFDAKAEAEQHFDDLPATIMRTSFYWDNFINLGMGPQPGPDGKLALTLPLGDARLPGIAAEDIGGAAYGLFRERLINTTLGIAGEMLTGTEMAAGFTRVLDQPVSYAAVEPEVFRGFGFPGADDMGNMFQFKRDFSEVYCGNRDLELTRRLNPQVKTFNQWLDANRHRITAPTG